MTRFEFDHEKMSEKDQERYRREMRAELKRLRIEEETARRERKPKA